MEAERRRFQGESPGEQRPGGERPASPPEPRPAATVILLRGGDDALEILLVERSPRARFMAGAWVFPGGAVDAAERRLDPEAGHRAAALRELREEAGIELGETDALVAFSRWITPEAVPIRYDARFYLAPAPADARPSVDGSECVAARWMAPTDALAAHGRDELPLVFPTIKHLEQLAPFHSATALLDHARGRDVAPVQPRVIGGEAARIVLPGEPGYDVEPGVEA